MRKTGWLFIMALLGLLVIGLVAGCGQKQGNDTAGKNASQQAPAAQPEPAKQAPAQKSEPAPAKVQPKQLQKLVIASPVKVLVFLPTYIGVAKGIFEAEGFNVENTVMKTDVAVGAMVSGDLDYATSIGTTIRAAATGIPVKVIMGIGTEMLFSIVTKPEVKSLNELRGKLVASSSATASTTFAGRAIFKINGMEPGKDIDFVYVGAGESRLAALASGQVAAAMLTVPDEELVGLKQGYKRLAYYPDVVPGHPFSGLGASDQKLKDKPEEVKKVIKAVLKSVDYIFKNKKETVEFIAKEWNMDQADADKSYDEVIKGFSKNGSISEKGLMVEINATKENAKITEDIPLSKVTDFTLLKQVQKEMGL